MGNEMGNRNVSGLQEEEKAVGEEIEKNLVGGECGDELKEENHVFPDVRDKDFHEKVDEVSGHEVLEDGDSLVEKQITDEKGQEDDSNDLKISSQSVEMEVPKESDEDKPLLLDSNFVGDKLVEDKITIEKETEETEAIGSTGDSTSSSTKQEICEDERVDNKVNNFQVIGSTDELIGITQEPILIVKSTSQEENGNDANIDEGGNGFPMVGSLDSSQEVCESPFAQENELIAKDVAPEEEKKGEVASLGNEEIGFPPVGSLDSSQEVCEPLEKLADLTQELEILVKEKAAQEEKFEVTNLGQEEIGFPLVGSLDFSQEACEPLDKIINLTQDPKSLVKDMSAQEDKCEVESVDEDGNSFPLAGSVLESSQEVFELQDETIGLPQEGKCEDGNGFQMVGSQEVCETQEKTIDLPQETESIVKESGTQEEKCGTGRVDEEVNSYPIFGSIDSSQEVCEKQEKSIGLTQETKSIIKESGPQEEKYGIGSVGEEGKGYPMVGSINSSQEVKEQQEVTLIVSKLLTVPTDLTVTEKICQENKSTEEIVTGNVSQSPQKETTITSPEGEKISTNKNPSSTIMGRKSPSFDFDLPLEARRSQDSDRTPLLCQDKAETRSISSRGQQSYQYSKVQLENEVVSVEEKTIMMERSYSDKSKAPFMSLSKKEEKGISVADQKEERDVGGYKKVEKEVILSSSKGSNGKRKPMSSFFATCICCDVSIV